MAALTNHALPSVTAAQTIAGFKAKTLTQAVSIVDTSGDIGLFFDQLAPLISAGDIDSITLTDTQPLSLTYASFVAGTQLLAKLGAAYSVVLSGVPVAGASLAQSSAHVTSYSIMDTTSAISTRLDDLNGLTRLKAIGLTNGSLLTLTASQFLGDANALSKLPSNYQVSLTGVLASGAGSSQTASHVLAFSVTDTAPNVIANLSALNAANKLGTITLVNTTALMVTFTQFNAFPAALARLAPNDLLIVSGVATSSAAAMQSNPRVGSFSIQDASAVVAAGLNLLNGATKLTTIVLNDAVPLAITAAQFSGDTSVIGKLPSSAKFVVSGVTAAAAAATQGNARIVSFGVSDTSANVVANLAALNAAPKLQTIVLSDSSALAVTLAQMSANASVFARLSPGYSLIVSLVTVAGAGPAQTNSHVRSFSLSDSSGNVAANLDALNGYGKLTSIVLTDAQPLSINFVQYNNNVATLLKIGGAWSAIVAGATADGASTLQANTHVRSFSVSDSATAVVANLDSLNNDGKLTSIVLTAGTTLALNVHQATADVIALNKITTSVQIGVSGAAISDLVAIQANTRVKSIQVTDSATNIVNALPLLNSNLLITSIALSGGTTLAVSYGQYSTYGATLGKLVTGNQLTVSGVTAAAAQTVQANGRVSLFTVSDTAANIVTNLGSLNADGKLSSIAIADTSKLSLGYSNFTANASALSKLTGNYTLAITGASAAGAFLVAANTHVSQFTVSDTLGNIGARLDQLEAAVKAGKLTSIAVTDSGGTIAISQTQYAADADAIALLHGAYTITHPSASGGAIINLIWDAKALAAPAAFRSAVTYAAQYFQTLITNPITVNINVGYGEVGGSTMGNGVLGAAGPTQGLGVTYAQFKSDLGLNNTSAAMQSLISSLSATDPANGGSIYVASAEEKALGLMSSNSTTLDGIMGFAADPNGSLFTYDPNNRAVAGKYDLIGVVEHEISHALGRIAIGGTWGTWISSLDVFRYSAPGVHSPNAGGNAYFSTNGGTTNLNWFSGTSDLGDWASSAGNDANDAFSRAGVVNQFTQTDIIELNALGFSTSGTQMASTVGQATATVSSGLNAPSLTFLGAPTIAFMTDDLPVIELSLSPPGGIVEIAQFQYGLNELHIDLRGAAPSSFVAFDTTIDGQHAIALVDSADTTRGLVLANMPAADTAADLMAHHLTFGGGQVFVA